MPERHHELKHCSAKEGDQGANEFDVFMLERHQELELVFVQMIGGGAQTLQFVAHRRAQTKRIWLK